MAYTTIDDPSAFFQAALYNGNAGTQTITNDGNSDLQPDMVWMKCRSGTHATENHRLQDSVRGVGKIAIPNGTTAADTGNTSSLTAFNSDGFSLGNVTDVNGDGAYVAWQWKKQAGVFDIQQYTGNGSNRTIAHNLGAIPTMMIIKKRNATSDWTVGHASLGANQKLELNKTTAVGTDASIFNNTRPTASVFTLGTDGDQNTDGHTYINYLFGNKKGMSKMGSYTGNGVVDGPFLYTGFKPAFVMVKRFDSTNYWFMFDNKRSTSGSNPTDKELYANDAAAEDTAARFDFLSNGIKNRVNTAGSNANGATYIYMAFAKNPFVSSTGIPATAE